MSGGINFLKGFLGKQYKTDDMILVLNWYKSNKGVCRSKQKKVTFEVNRILHEKKRRRKFEGFCKDFKKSLTFSQIKRN